MNGLSPCVHASIRSTGTQHWHATAETKCENRLELALHRRSTRLYLPTVIRSSAIRYSSSKSRLDLIYISSFFIDSVVNFIAAVNIDVWGCK